MTKYTQDYKKKEQAYLDAGFKKVSTTYRDGVKRVKYIRDIPQDKET